MPARGHFKGVATAYSPRLSCSNRAQLQAITSLHPVRRLKEQESELFSCFWFDNFETNGTAQRIDNQRNNILPFFRIIFAHVSSCWTPARHSIFFQRKKNGMKKKQLPTSCHFKPFFRKHRFLRLSFSPLPYSLDLN